MAGMKKAVAFAGLLVLANPGQVHADPISIAVAAVSTVTTGFGVAAGTATFLGAGLFGSTFLAGAFGHFVISAALGFGLNLLSPQPGKPKDTGYQVNQRGGTFPHAIIYGETVVGGVVFYDEVTDDNLWLHRCIAFAGHEIESFEKFYLNDRGVTLDGSGFVTAPSLYTKTSNACQILTYDGSQTAASTQLVNRSDGKWTSDMVANGVAYVYIRFKFNRDVYPNGIPTLTARIRGKKVYDPRTDTTAWSSNPALCIRDYITSDYGLNADEADINDTLFSSAADICDEAVALSGGGTEDRYRCDGSFTTNSTPRNILDSMTTSIAGYISYSQGQWFCVPGKYVAPTKSLDEDDLRSNLSVSPRHPRSTNFNRVGGIFKSGSTKWKETNYPTVTSAAFVTQDGGLINEAELDLPFCRGEARCQRIAKIALFRHRQQQTVTASFGLNAFDVALGEIVQFSYERWGWTNKEFECVDWAFVVTEEGELRIDLSLREISSAVFDWNAEESALEDDDTNLPDADVTSEVGVTLSSELRIINQKVSGVLQVDLTASSSGYVSLYEVEYKKSTDSTWTTSGRSSGSKFEIFDVADIEYDIRARMVNTFGVAGPWNTTLNYLVSAFADPPSDVSNFRINVIDGLAHLEWDAVPDLDLSHYVIRHSPLVSGATYIGSSIVAPKVARPATSVSIPYRSGTYFIQSVDKIGGEGTTPSSVVTNVGDIEGMNAVQTVTEDPSFSGTKSNLVVASSVLSIDDRSTEPSTGTYDFNTVVDLTEKYVSRITGSVDFVRDDLSGALFDSVAGLFDSAVGLFDGAVHSDCNVVLQVALTDDDPNASPTWSSWIDFTAGDFSARGLKFRAVLSSQTIDVSPAISALSVTIDMPDRVVAGADIASGTSPFAVTFSPAFKGLTGVGISAQGMATGDYYLLSAKSATGFTIEFRNSSDTTVSRTFDYVARGYGKVTT